MSMNIKTFIVNINLSEMFKEEQSNFVMLIDCRKMTIVYELIEWLRWIFSIETCFYITHKNFVIHELEDIKILRALQTLELKPCKKEECAHKMLYMKLLKNIDFYGIWNATKVPKMFLETLSQIKKKISNDKHELNEPIDFENTLQNQSINFNKSISNAMPNKNEVDYKESFDILKPTKETTLEAKKLQHTESEPENLYKDKTHLFNNQNIDFQHEGTLIYDVEMQENKAAETANNSMFNSPKNYFLHKNSCKPKVNSDSENSFLKKPESPVDSPMKQIIHTLNTSKKKVRAEFNTSKKKYNYIKPFSVAGILKDLRSEYESNQKVIANTLPAQSPIHVTNKETSGKAENIDLAFTEEYEKKKRKRVRKHRSKPKLKHDTEYTSLTPFNTPHRHDTETYVQKAPSHIRFNNSYDDDDNDDDDDDEVNETIRKECTPVGKESNNEIEIDDHKNENCSENEKLNIDKLLSMVNEKKQALLSGYDKNNSTNKSLENLIDCSNILQPTVFERFF